MCNYNYLLEHNRQKYPTSKNLGKILSTSDWQLGRTLRRKCWDRCFVRRDLTFSIRQVYTFRRRYNRFDRSIFVSTDWCIFGKPISCSPKRDSKVISSTYSRKAFSGANARGRNSQNFIRKLVRFFVTLGLKILRL